MTSTPVFAPIPSTSKAAHHIPDLSTFMHAATQTKDDLELLFQEARDWSPSDEDGNEGQDDPEADIKAYKAARAYPLQLEDQHMILSNTIVHEDSSTDSESGVQHRPVKRCVQGTTVSVMPFAAHC